MSFRDSQRQSPHCALFRPVSVFPATAIRYYAASCGRHITHGLRYPEGETATVTVSTLHPLTSDPGVPPTTIRGIFDTAGLKSLRRIFAFYSAHCARIKIDGDDKACVCTEFTLLPRRLLSPSMSAISAEFFSASQVALQRKPSFHSLDPWSRVPPLLAAIRLCASTASRLEIDGRLSRACCI